MTSDVTEKNILSSAPIGWLMLKYAIPSVIALVVNALYNIVDQIFIGWGVGTLGNSATNVIFPLNMVMMALALLIGDGGAAYLSLELGRGNKDKASKGVNNTFSWLIVVAILFFIVCFVFLKPLTALFGATPDNLEYALTYGRIILFGFPFAMVGCGFCSLIRADGTPQLTMIAMVVGCVSNIILDALFVLRFGWGMEGAAIATVIGQILNFVISMWYIPRFKTIKINISEMKPKFSLLKRISGLGISSFVSQIAVAVVMTVINYYLVHCGAKSEYGSDIPLAAFGIVMKFNTILTSIVTGIGTGSQPIVGYNYGSGDYGRVKNLSVLRQVLPRLSDCFSS
ncbi:MAG: MATE family efflux transporter [Clostridiales bacterium]|nr:MATE family efflux transporter [Clostridiales bacterium]